MSWYATLKAVQTVIGDALAAALLEDDPAPSFSSVPAVVIMPGEQAWDECPRVALFVGGVQPLQRACSVKLRVEYRIRMTVCTPGEPNTKVATWEAEAKRLYDLTEIVLRAVTSNLATLFGSCEEAEILPLAVLNPSGGQAGVEFGVLTS